MKLGYYIRNSVIAAAILLFLRFVYKCPSMLFFDFPCPGCGMTRAVWYFLTFRFGLSFAYNPLAIFVVVGALYVLFVRHKKKLPVFWEHFYLYALCAALIAVWVIRFFVTGWSVAL